MARKPPKREPKSTFNQDIETLSKRFREDREKRELRGINQDLEEKRKNARRKNFRMRKPGEK